MLEQKKLNDDSLTSSEQLNQYESARRSKNTPAVKSPCFGYSIVALSAAAEWLLSGCSFVHEDLDYKESLSGAFNECKLSHEWK